MRDLARTLKKDIGLLMVGEETDLDKNLVEALADHTPGPCPDLPPIEAALGLQRVAPKPGGPRKRNSRRG